MKSVLRTLSVMLLTAAAVIGAGVWAADIEDAGLPMTQDGSLWARKSGTTNTKQDLVSTSNALHVNVTSSTPPTGTSATQVQGTAADGGAAVGNPVQIGGKDGSGNAQTILTGTDGSVSVTFSSVDPCQSSGTAKSSVVLNHTATAELVAISGTTVIYVCGFSISMAGTAPTYQFRTGTGAVCATGPVVKTGVYTPASAAPYSHAAAATIFKGAAGEALCITIAGTTPSAQGFLTYVQQ